MADITIENAAEYRTDVPVDDRGRVVIGNEYAGQNVNVVVETERDTDD